MFVNNKKERKKKKNHISLLLFICVCVLLWKMARSVVHTILDAALKVVDDGCKDGRQVHYMSALSKTQSEQLVPTGSHQTCVCLLTEKRGKILINNNLVVFAKTTACVKTFSPESWEGWDWACPVHGEEEKSRCRFTDVVYIQILGHGAGHGQLEERYKHNTAEKDIKYKNLTADRRMVTQRKHNASVKWVAPVNAHCTKCPAGDLLVTCHIFHCSPCFLPVSLQGQKSNKHQLKRNLK